ncbi:MAG: diguanylate cyclase domain-containing protein [Gammaproteobacteria bacterium]
MDHLVLPDIVMRDLECVYPIFELVKNGVTLTDENSKILYVNPAFSKITGYARDEAIGENPGILHSGVHDDAFYKDMWNSLSDKGFWEGKIWNRNKSGRVYPELLTITRLLNPEGKVCNYLAIFSDITVLNGSDTEEVNLAFYDPLTRLANRLALEEYFRKMKAAYDRKKYQGEKQSDKIVLVFFDLNKFKVVNDTHGHLVGDKLLKAIAERLNKMLRESDIIARFGGDEFVAMAADIQNEQHVHDFCQRIKNVFIKPFIIDNLSIDSSASIGVSIYPDDGKDFETLVRLADENMYKEKEMWRKSHENER